MEMEEDIVSWSATQKLEPYMWMINKNCTGRFKIELVLNGYIISQEITKRKLFKTITKFEHIPELMTQSSDDADRLLKEIKDLYKPILRERRLNKVLNG